MPYQTKKECAFPNCHRVTNKRYCSQCEKTVNKQHEARRETATRRGYTSRKWRIIRHRILERDPMCTMCNCELSNVCDHIVPISQGGSDDDKNLQGVCLSCHSGKTAMEDGGFGNVAQGSVQRGAG